MAKSRFSDIVLQQMGERYREGLSQSEIAREFGLSQQGVDSILRRIGVESRKTKAWKMLDEHYFDFVDTEEKAYWLGFLGADGWCYKSKNGGCMVGLSLKLSDRGHIEKFRNAICSKAKICNRVGRGRQESQLLFKSVVMYNRLHQLGIREGKSRNFIPIVPVGFECHFWRGMVDGDGSLPVMCRYGHQRIVIELVGTRDVCEGFRNFGEKVAGKMQGISSYGTYCRVGVEGRVAKKLIGVLYGGAGIYLQRKCDIAVLVM